MNNLKQNANLLACYSKVSDKHVFFFIPPLNIPIGPCFFHSLAICRKFWHPFGTGKHLLETNSSVCKFWAKCTDHSFPKQNKSKKGDAISQIWDFFDCFNMLQIFNLIPCPVVFSLGPLKSLPAHDVSLPCFCWSTSLGYHQAQASPFALASSTFWQQKSCPVKLTNNYPSIKPKIKPKDLWHDICTYLFHLISYIYILHIYLKYINMYI